MYCSLVRKQSKGSVEKGDNHHMIIGSKFTDKIMNISIYSLFFSRVNHIPSRKKKAYSYLQRMLFYITDVSLREVVEAVIILIIKNIIC